MLNHQGTQLIKTQRLVLRKFTMQDAEMMFANWANDPLVTRYMTWEPHGQLENTRGIIGGWLAEYGNSNFYHWAIVSKSNMQPVGSLGCVAASERDMCCELGYCLSRSLWNQGLTSEALRAVISFLFHPVGFNRIQAKHHIANPASGKVMQKAGMVYEGTLREAMYKENHGFYNCPIYAILAPK